MGDEGGFTALIPQFCPSARRNGLPGGKLNGFDRRILPLLVK
jgi:hypothetical protein